MPLSPGTRLGPYEIVAPIGSGGMGEVFRARDTRLDRSVAVKILSSAVVANAQLRTRFEREARTISQLNHPHICTLYDIGHEGDVSYIVMELVEGESLAARLARGPMPLADVYRYGAQIADALDRAHKAGIVHRDLKPGNIMVTKSGAKLLDFGLARSYRGTVVDSEAVTQQNPVTSDGMILGTLPYMAPEQLLGEEVDARADIFSFGAVLYEMVTGRRAFTSPNSASLIAAILEHQPPKPSEVQSITPPLLEHLILRSLEKDRDARFQCAGDIAHELRFLASARVITESGAAVVPAARPRRLWPIVAVALLLALGAIAAAYRMRGTSSPRVEAEFVQLTFDRGEEREPSIAPDAKTFVFVKEVDGQSDIFLQRIDGTTAINLTNEPRFDDTEPAFSPDGSRIAFRSERDGGGIFLMGATGESVRRLTDKGYSPSWSADGRSVIFAQQRLVDPSIAYGLRNLFIADVTTGATRLFYDGIDVLQPALSPHGKRVAFMTSKRGQRDVMTIDGKGTASSITHVTADAPTDWNPVWARDGKSLFFASDRGGSMNLWRVAIDEESGRVDDAPAALAVPASAVRAFSVAADDRHIVYQANAPYSELHRLRFDAATVQLHPDSTPLLRGSMHIRYPSASPDGKWIAFTGSTPQEDIYVMASDGTGLRQLTHDGFRDRGVSWTPDSSRIVFYSTRAQDATEPADYNVWSIRPDGSGLTQMTAIEGGVNFPRVSPDLQRIAVVTDASNEAGGISRIGSSPITRIEERFPPSPRGRVVPLSWSPDGTRIACAPYGARGLYIYSTVTKQLTDLGVESRTSAFIDNDRVLFIDGEDRLGIIDSRTRVTRMIGTLPNDSGLRTESWGSLSTGTASLLVVRHRAESDLWLMRLKPAE